MSAGFVARESRMQKKAALLRKLSIVQLCQCELRESSPSSFQRRKNHKLLTMATHFIKTYTLENWFCFPPFYLLYHRIPSLSLQ